MEQVRVITFSRLGRKILRCLLNSLCLVQIGDEIVPEASAWNRMLMRGIEIVGRFKRGTIDITAEEFPVDGKPGYVRTTYTVFGTTRKG